MTDQGRTQRMNFLPEADIKRLMKNERRKGYKRQNATSENVIRTQTELESTWILEKLLCIKTSMENRVSDKVTDLNNAMIPLGILAGILMFFKGVLTGGLSIAGLFVQLIYFAILTIAALGDEREDWASRFIPSVSGLFLCASQLIGIFIVNGPFECENFVECF
ncbi:MAG: hypothetical protein CMF41_01250 [Legionellales bacterium]|nr:hypothetical protein [Legionellales bacterium]|tara:strand:- start:3369 stop:3860 length:492 start_codon:yes stop_codon:yes gene_type:complete